MPAREVRKVAVLGGTGRVGHVVVREALDAGHSVRVLVRGPDTGPAHERLEVVRGDATDPGAVERLVRGCDSVISAIGHRQDSPPDVQTVAVRHAIAAMQVHGTRRLVSVTVGAVPDPRDRPRAVHRLAGFIGRTVARTQVADAMEHAAVVRASDVEWVLVRAAMIKDRPASDYRVGFVGVNDGPRVSRRNLARFVVDQLVDDRHLRTAPMVSD